MNCLKSIILIPRGCIITDLDQSSNVRYVQFPVRVSARTGTSTRTRFKGQRVLSNFNRLCVIILAQVFAGVVLALLACFSPAGTNQNVLILGLYQVYFALSEDMLFVGFLWKHLFRL